jgi:predicted DNA-binding transcriptional regulator AlpA
MAKALRLPAVMEETGLAKPTIYKHIKTGKFPPGISRTDMRLHTWDADEIAAWKRGEWKAEEVAA